MIKTTLLLNSIGYAALALAAADSGTDAGTGPKEVGEVETGFFSLAQLAGADTDSITAITSRVPTPGLWTVIGKKVAGSESQTDGKPPLVRFGFQMEVIGGEATDPAFDNTKMVGRTVTETRTLWPKDIEEGIGLLKGSYQKIGLANSGMPMGGVEGMAPGWLDGIVGHTFTLQIRNYIKDGETRAAYEWKPAPEAAIDEE